jgi:hypothetical protein
MCIRKERRKRLLDIPNVCSIRNYNTTKACSTNLISKEIIKIIKKIIINRKNILYWKSLKISPEKLEIKKKDENAKEFTRNYWKS